MTSRHAYSVVLVSLALAACSAGAVGPAPSPPPLSDIAPLNAPSAPGAGEPNLAVAPDGTFLLSWIEALDDGAHALRFARRAPGGPWSEVRSIAEGRDWFVNWADFPALASLPDGTLFAHWLQKSGPGTYAYDVRLVISRDGGATWDAPFSPHTDGTQSEHGFVSLVPLDAAQMGVVWLDGRETVGADGALKGHTEHGAQMTLRYAAIPADGGAWDEVLLDGRVCDCCQTAATLSGGRLVVAYRDRSADEVRDIAFVRRDAASWSEPAVLGADGWRIEGCPVNGPALDGNASGRAVAAWFGAPETGPHVRAAFSSDAGASWAAPLRVDEGRPIGRVDAVLLPDGDALVSWLEQTDAGTQLLVRRVDASGEAAHDAQRIGAADSARSGGFPRMALSGDEILVAWRARGEPGGLQLATARLTP